MSDTIDHRQLLAEIDDEVRRRRESGDLPADFERELAAVFARFAPPGATGDDFDAVVERAERYAFVDVLAPVDSALPLVPHVKRLVRKAISWEVRHVARQVTAFASTLTGAVRALGERVDALEQAHPPGERLRRLAPPPSRPIAPGLAPAVVEAVAGAPGPVLHAECGDGELVSCLLAAGLDAYGVGAVGRDAPSGVDVRAEEPLAHLAGLPDAALGAVVLDGCVDRLPLGALVDLAALVAAKVAPGGVVVVVSSDPRAWGAAHSAVEADLSAGRPLHAATWSHLLGRAGLVEITTLPCPPDARPPADSVTTPEPGFPPAVLVRIERLEQALLPPAGYAVVARRPS